MDILAFILPLLTFMIPIFIMFIVYVGVLVLIIWFIISFLNIQKERNRLLANISKQMKQTVSCERNHSMEPQKRRAGSNDRKNSSTAQHE